MIQEMQRTSSSIARSLGVASVFLLLQVTFSPAARAQTQTGELSVDVSASKGEVSPRLYGLMTEEINHSYDGGLYAELVNNRSFQGRSLEHWSIYQLGQATGTMRIDQADGPSSAQSKSLSIEVTAGATGDAVELANDGYWGMAVRPSTVYRGSVYLKGEGASLEPVEVSLVNDGTGKVLAQAKLKAPGGTWQRQEFTLRSGPDAASQNNRVLVTFRGKGIYKLDLLSVFPPTFHDRANGNRVDLMEMLGAMKPKFLRFPGGNYLEGDLVADRFDWKKTLGPLVDRPTHQGPWRYRSSDGMGLLEFLDWCEDLHMDPLLAVYAGYSLKGDHVEPGPALEPYVQDALEEIEYVTGPVDSTWGARRAKDGHPAPFPLTYVEIGNEDQFDKAKTYDARFAQIATAIRKRYPKLQLIATAPVTTVTPDVLDEHFYEKSAHFMTMTHRYDTRDRKGPKIFVGEWATREGMVTPNFGATLSDAAWLTGLERNSDLVIMASYAPLLTNVNADAQEWEPDLIGYDALHSFGSPSYYMQIMFNTHLGNKILDPTTTGCGERFFTSATRDGASGMIYLKLVNATNLPCALTVDLKGASGVAAHAQQVRLSGNSFGAQNSIEARKAVVPVETRLDGIGTHFAHTVPPRTIEVLDLPMAP